MTQNVVDVLVRVKNQVVGLFVLDKLKESLKFIVDQIEEAQEAAAQLDRAFKANGQGLGLTRQRLDDIAASLQNTTTFSDDLVKKSEAVLLTFNRVRKEGFERTIRAAADLASVPGFGQDLISSVKLLGKALEDPERGLTQLRRAGVTFSDSQAALIKNLKDTGQAAAAQNLILAEVEKRFKGAAEASRNTLGGAIEGLKNAFGDLFESTQEGTSGAVGAINELSKSFQDPKIKEGVDNLIKGLAKVLELLLKIAAASASAAVSIGDKIGNTASKLLGFKTDSENLASLIKERQELLRLQKQGRPDTQLQAFLSGKGAQKDALDSEIESRGVKDFGAFIANKLRFVEAQIARERQVQSKATQETVQESKAATEQQIAYAQQLDEVVISLRKKEKDANEQVIDDFNERSKTSAEKAIAEYNEIAVAAIEARKAGRIDDKQFDARIKEAQDNLLPEFDIGQISSQLRVVQKQASETAEIIKGAFQQAGASIQSSLSEAIQSGKLNLRSLVDVARKAFADIAAALIVSGVKKLFAGLLSSGGTGASTGSTTGGLLRGLAGAFLGAKATGGTSTAPFIAGENGPELIFPGTSGASVINKQQMAFAGLGGGAIFAPQTNISIIERENPQQTKEEILRTVAIQSARDQEKFMQRLAKNGVKVR